MKTKLLGALLVMSVFGGVHALAADLRFEIQDLVVKNCPLDVAVYLDVDDEIPAALDVKVLANESYLWQDFTANMEYFYGYQFLSGTAMGSGAIAGEYRYMNYYDIKTGALEASNSSWLLGHIQVLPVGDSLDLQFYMLGSGVNSDDSTVAYGMDNNTTFVDILHSTNSISLPVLDGACGALTSSEKSVLDKLAVRVLEMWMSKGVAREDGMKGLAVALENLPTQQLQGYVQYILLVMERV